MTMNDRFQPYGFLVLGLVHSLLLLSCTSRQPIDDRVPASAMEEALHYVAPFGDTHRAPSDIVAAGKALYEGTGRCVLCHGVSGKGDGPAAHLSTPVPPRDFTDCAVQADREDGELFWVIKYGSPGTAMPPFIPRTLSEEDGWKVLAYIRTFSSCTVHS
jgi:mono/diheme cytochrome c family protein